MVFFSAKRPGVPGGWQLYAIGVDGKGLKQITSGPGNRISPAELPDGRIVFVSDHADTWVQCQGKKAGLILRKPGHRLGPVAARVATPRFRPAWIPHPGRRP